jgi:hypothetical protein
MNSAGLGHVQARPRGGGRQNFAARGRGPQNSEARGLARLVAGAGAPRGWLWLRQAHAPSGVGDSWQAPGCAKPTHPLADAEPGRRASRPRGNVSRHLAARRPPRLGTSASIRPPPQPPPIVTSTLITRPQRYGRSASVRRLGCMGSSQPLHTRMRAARHRVPKLATTAKTGAPPGSEGGGYPGHGVPPRSEGGGYPPTGVAPRSEGGGYPRHGVAPRFEGGGYPRVRSRARVRGPGHGRRRGPDPIAGIAAMVDVEVRPLWRGWRPWSTSRSGPHGGGGGHGRRRGPDPIAGVAATLAMGRGLEAGGGGYPRGGP